MSRRGLLDTHLLAPLAPVSGVPCAGSPDFRALFRCVAVTASAGSWELATSGAAVSTKAGATTTSAGATASIGSWAPASAATAGATASAGVGVSAGFSVRPLLPRAGVRRGGFCCVTAAAGSSWAWASPRGVPCRGSCCVAGAGVRALLPPAPGVRDLPLLPAVRPAATSSSASAPPWRLQARWAIGELGCRAPSTGME